MYWGEDDPENVAAPVDGSPTTLRGFCQAVIYAIEAAIRRGCRMLTIRTSTEHFSRRVMKKVSVWKRRGWRHRDGRSVEDVDLLMRLDLLQGQIRVEFDSSEDDGAAQKAADRLAYDGAQKCTAFSGNREVSELDV